MRHQFCAHTASCALVCISLVIGSVLSACSATQSDFTRQTASAAGEFGAAALTLSDAHRGRLAFAYARGSFVNYQSQLDGLDAQLPSFQGAPDYATTRHLLDLYAPAMRAVAQPCLDNGCDWRAQVDALNRASAAFRQASEASA